MGLVTTIFFYWILHLSLQDWNGFFIELMKLLLSLMFLSSCRDNFLILHAFMAAMACYTFPFLGNLPFWNWRGGVFALLLHIGVSEPLYYWIHRKLHVGHLFTNYHSLHHSAVVPQPFTGTRNNKNSLYLISSSHSNEVYCWNVHS